MIHRPSPNWGTRPAGATIEMLILHYTGMASAGAALDRLCDEAARVSAHYLIDEDGTVFSLVGEAMRAWHAGAASWQGATDINDRSIGIELVNPGHEFGYQRFAEAQLVALIELAGEILARHPIPPAGVLGHSDVAPLRKQDPGELFPWRRLAAAGIGIWPEAAAAGEGDTPDQATQMLTGLGYATGAKAETRAAIIAFQRRYRPDRLDGVLDFETMALIRALAGAEG